MSWFLVAFLAHPVLQQNTSCSSWGSCRPAPAALHSLITGQLQVQHLWDIQRKLPKMQSIHRLCFSLTTFDFPFYQAEQNMFELQLSVSVWRFPSSGFSGEEFGVNGPVFDAVAKKPWLGSQCPFAVWRVPPWWKRSCFSLLACPEQGVLCSQLAWLKPSAEWSGNPISPVFYPL